MSTERQLVPSESELMDAIRAVHKEHPGVNVNMLFRLTMIHLKGRCNPTETMRLINLHLGISDRG